MTAPLSSGDRNFNLRRSVSYKPSVIDRNVVQFMTIFFLDPEWAHMLSASLSSLSFPLVSREDVWLN